MKRAIPLFFALFASFAHGVPTQPEPTQPASFDARVQLAKNLETDERFKTYRPAMLRRTGRHLARSMRSCIAVSPVPEQKSVVLVADISAEGKATEVEVKPDNAVARCLAKGFSSVSYPKPPAYSERPGFPVTIKIQVVR